MFIKIQARTRGKSADSGSRDGKERQRLVGGKRTAATRGHLCEALKKLDRPWKNKQKKKNKVRIVGISPRIAAAAKPYQDIHHKFLIYVIELLKSSRFSREMRDEYLEKPFKRGEVIAAKITVVSSFYFIFIIRLKMWIFTNLKKEDFVMR